MSQIDNYIARATAGLPSRERIDTAAELRVHLNAQVKKHMLEGHTSEEAEFLAVDAMGAVAKVNRQFLGHIFTPRVGWGVLIASVIGLAGWFGGKAFLENQTYAREIPISSKDVVDSLGRYWSFEYRMPPGTKSYYFSWNTPEFGQNQFSYSNVNLTNDSKIIKVLLWISKDDFSKCNPQKNKLHWQIVNGLATNNTGVSSSIRLPCFLNGKEVAFGRYGDLKILPQLDKWQIIADLSPYKRLNGMFPDRTFKTNQRVVIQIYASSKVAVDSEKEDGYVFNPPTFLEHKTGDYFEELKYRNNK